MQHHRQIELHLPLTGAHFAVRADGTHGERRADRDQRRNEYDDQRGD